jgi:nitroimidazol reductase NimA-like FMN-containing flavoprotein (pyridoxamine 5'-phosphate oxidase superfamily)
VKTDRTTIKRFPERGSHDREVIDSILDEALVCHIGFLGAGGEPVVIPSIHAREGDNLYLHGAPASRMMKTLSEGGPISIAVTLLDGIVVARAPTHSTYNYRSVVIFARAVRIRDEEEKLAALRTITEHVTPGRWDDSRHPTKAEIDRTAIVRVPLAEASAKISTGFPEDEEEDYDLDIWAGVIPLALTAGDPQPDPRLKPGIDIPEYLGR